MSQLYNSEYFLIQTIDKMHSSLDQHAINRILNQELFYHAKQELPYHIPNQHTPPTTHQLASKILRQLPANDQEQLIDQLIHRLQICKDDREDQLEQLKIKWAREKEKISKSGATVKQFHRVYEQQVSQGVSLQNNLTKKTVSYFETNRKDKPIEEMMTDLLGQVLPPDVEYLNNQEGEVQMKDQARQLCDQLLEQFKLVESAFNFQD